MLKFAWSLRQKTASTSLKTYADCLTPSDRKKSPYPPDIFPNGCFIATEYGDVRAYCFGREDKWAYPGDMNKEKKTKEIWNGETVTLLCGISTPCVGFRDLAYGLISEGYRVVTFDLYGRGYSSSPPKSIRHNADLYINQTRSVLSHFNITETHLVGYSFGGCLALCYAAIHPSSIRSLTLLAPGGLIPTSALGMLGRLLEVPPPLDSKKSRCPLSLLTLPDWVYTIIASLTIMKDLKPLKGREVVPACDWTKAIDIDGVVCWQGNVNADFQRSLVGSFRYGPCFGQDAVWERVGGMVDRFGPSKSHSHSGFSSPSKSPSRSKKIFLMLASDDTLVPPSLTLPKAKQLLRIPAPVMTSAASTSSSCSTSATISSLKTRIDSATHPGAHSSTTGEAALHPGIDSDSDQTLLMDYAIVPGCHAFPLLRGNETARRVVEFLRKSQGVPER